MDLVTKVAELQFRNRDFVLMFRGQSGDFKNRFGYTSLKSTFLRAAGSNKVPTDATLNRRFEKLIAAESALIEEYCNRKLIGRQRLQRQRVLKRGCRLCVWQACVRRRL